MHVLIRVMNAPCNASRKKMPCEEEKRDEVYTCDTAWALLRGRYRILISNVALKHEIKHFILWARLKIAQRNLGVPNYRIRPRPCRRQPQDHTTPAVPRALRRIQEAKKRYSPPHGHIVTMQQTCSQPCRARN